MNFPNFFFLFLWVLSSPGSGSGFRIRRSTDLIESGSETLLWAEHKSYYFDLKIPIFVVKHSVCFGKSLEFLLSPCNHMLILFASFTTNYFCLHLKIITEEAPRES